jgi:hypothetical protein
MTDPSNQDRWRVPDGIDPTGVPTSRSAREAFIVTAALLVAVLALVFTLGWVVYNQIT